MSRALFRALILLAFLVSVGALDYLALRSGAAGPAAQAKHGLTGNYYVSTLETHGDSNPTGRDFFVQVWFDPNDFQLPRVFSQPAAVRVDSQIAFGQGKGFAHTARRRTAQWAPSGYEIPKGFVAPSGKPWEHLAAVVWKGYIHLPKPGTYYFATISHGPSAVYLNNARVALNGNFGGVLVSGDFSYPKESAKDYVQNAASGREDVAFSPRPKETYVVPVPTDAPRDLPIEVQYQAWVDTQGIDLYWVTPDSPRDANGKPIAQIVPADVLYAEPPGSIEKPTVRSANSTISADFLYFPSQSTDQWIAATIRLADRDGKPVAGKRVYVSGVTSYGGPDSIVQPEKPTDEKGETTAKLRAGEGYKVAHDSMIFATDVTDLVDASQVAHVSFVDASNSFFPDTYAPYYDGNKFLIEPLPVQVGRPVTIKVPLQNRLKNAAEVVVSFQANDWNIGRDDWKEIGTAKGIKLKPGERTEVSTTWTPEKTTGHLCFRVVVSGHLITATLPSGNVLQAALLPINLPTAIAAGHKPVPPPAPPAPTPTPGDTNFGSLQQNVGPVTPAPPPKPDCPPNPFVPLPPPPADCDLVCHAKQIALGGARGWERQKRHAQAKSNISTEIYYDPLCDKRCKDRQQAVDKRYKERSGLYGQAVEDACKVANEPPNPDYGKLAIAPSDTVGGYLEAIRISMEGYQGARAQGDTEWMARHLTALRLYQARLGATLRREADAYEEEARHLPADTAETSTIESRTIKQLQEQLRRQGGAFTKAQLAQFQSAGISEEDAQSVAQVLLAQGDFEAQVTLSSIPREAADDDREFAAASERMATQPVNMGEEGKSGQPLSQTYTVGNPRDKQETVDLYVRPISIPADWKLSIVNTEQAQGNPQAAKAGNAAPQFPVREVEPGKHYAVTLPAKGQVQVASVLIPMGEVGANTTARWAVEGKIGDELIGGMVHEMNVPYIIADLKLPPVGSKEEEEMESPAATRSFHLVLIAGSAGLLVLVAFVLLLLSRRRAKDRTVEPR